MNCDTVRLIIQSYPLNQKLEINNRSPETALSHYLNCKDCRLLGLSAIKKHSISCQEAFEILAVNPLPLEVYIPLTLEEVIAKEHVWGDDYSRQFEGLRKHQGQCQKAPCQKLFNYWLNHAVTEKIPLMIKIFTDNQWPLEKLLDLQTRQLNEILELEAKRPDRYLKSGALRRRIMANLKVLQDLVKQQR